MSDYKIIMDENNFQTNMNTLKEMLLDEEKLVTYVSLSKEMCIHVNDSKLLLTKLIAETKKKQSDIALNVSYIMSGLSEDNKARTLVLSERDIETFRKTLKTIFFEHVYSVSKGHCSIDNVALLATNKLEDFPLCTGLIKSNTCSKHSTDELGALKSNSQSSVVTAQKPAAVPPKIVKEEPKKQVLNGIKDLNLETVNKSEPIVKKEISSPEKEIYTKSKVDNKKNAPKTQKGIAGFFSKSNVVSSSKKIVKDNLPKKEEMKQDDEQMDIDVTDLDNNAVEKESIQNIKIEKKNIKTENGSHGSKKMENGSKKLENGSKKLEKGIKKSENELNKEKKVEVNKEKGKTKSVSEIKKNAKVDKKRKRVLQVSDSESEDEKDPFIDETPIKSDHESEDEIPPTPVATVKIASGLIHPRKKRKIVDKTYTDEDGYILTKKEEVYESCSDQEDVEIKENVQKQPQVQIKQETSPKDKKSNPKNGKKKVSPPQKGKQATLMNFFKKV